MGPNFSMVQLNKSEFVPVIRGRKKILLNVVQQHTYIRPIRGQNQIVKSGNSPVIGHELDFFCACICGCCRQRGEI